MQYNKRYIMDKIERLRIMGFKVDYTCHGGDGLVWWVQISGDVTRNGCIGRIERSGGTREVAIWLYGVINGLWLVG